MADSPESQSYYRKKRNKRVRPRQRVVEVHAGGGGGGASICSPPRPTRPPHPLSDLLRNQLASLDDDLGFVSRFLGQKLLKTKSFGRQGDNNSLRPIGYRLQDIQGEIPFMNLQVCKGTLATLHPDSRYVIDHY